MRNVSDLRTAFLRVRVIFIVAPFVLPILFLAESILAARGVSSAPYILTIISIVWLSTKLVKAWREYGMGGAAAVRSTDIAVSMSKALMQHIKDGADPAVTIENSFGFGIGLCMGNFGWTPARVREEAFLTAQAIQHQSDRCTCGTSHH